MKNLWMAFVGLSLALGAPDISRAGESQNSEGEICTNLSTSVKVKGVEYSVSSHICASLKENSAGEAELITDIGTGIDETGETDMVEEKICISTEVKNGIMVLLQGGINLDEALSKNLPQGFPIAVGECLTKDYSTEPQIDTPPNIEDTI